MRALHVALHAFGTEHAAIERELFPRLESDDLVVSETQPPRADSAGKTQNS